MQSSELKSRLADFARTHGIAYPLVLSDFKTTRQIGALDVLPSSYLYNRSGEQVSYHAGVVTRADIERYIRDN